MAEDKRRKTIDDVKSFDDTRLAVVVAVSNDTVILDRPLATDRAYTVIYFWDADTRMHGFHFDGKAEGNLVHLLNRKEWDEGEKIEVGNIASLATYDPDYTDMFKRGELNDYIREILSKYEVDQNYRLPRVRK